MELEEVLKRSRKSVNGRRILSYEGKRLIVEAWEESGMSGPEFCRQYGLILTSLYHWRKTAIRGAAMGIQNSGELYGKVEYEALKRENEELKKALGESTLDIRILKGALETHKKKRNFIKSNNLVKESKQV